jgi:hypothetical protein
VLTSTAGTWVGSAPISYGQQWQRCAAEGACADISGATGTTYALTPADVGHTIRIVVTADNPAPGTVSATSPATALVEARAMAAPPAAGGPPPDHRPPALMLTVSPGHVLQTGKFATWLTCTSEACRATLRGTLTISAGAARVYRLGPVRRRLARGRRMRVDVRVAPRARLALRRALRRHVRVALRLAVTVEDQAGNATTRHRALRLTAAGRGAVRAAVAPAWMSPLQCPLPAWSHRLWAVFSGSSGRAAGSDACGPGSRRGPVVALIASHLPSP